MLTKIDCNGDNRKEQSREKKRAQVFPDNIKIDRQQALNNIRETNIIFSMPMRQVQPLLKNNVSKAVKILTKD